MTTIVAKRLTKKNGEPKGIVFAYDDQSTRGYQKNFINTKIAHNGVVTFGLAGAIRDLNLLTHSLVVPKFGKKAKANPESWVVNKLVPAIKKVLEDGGNLETQHGQSSSDSMLILSVPGVCGYLGHDFAFTGSDHPYWSVGSGEKYAFGALACGATAGDAVTVAGSFDVFTGKLRGTVKVKW